MAIFNSYVKLPEGSRPKMHQMPHSPWIFQWLFTYELGLAPLSTTHEYISISFYISVYICIYIYINVHIYISPSQKWLVLDPYHLEERSRPKEFHLLQAIDVAFALALPTAKRELSTWQPFKAPELVLKAMAKWQVGWVPGGSEWIFWLSIFLPSAFFGMIILHGFKML